MSKEENFSFLKDLVLEEVTNVGPKGLGGRKVDQFPVEEADLRVFKNGSVYPSKEFAEQYDLEYQKKDSTKKSNGMDMFLSTDFGQLISAFKKSGKELPAFLLCTVISKAQSKVDLFGSVKYENDEPKSSVLTQGGSFGKQLWEMMENLPDANLEGLAYVDLVVMSDKPLNSTDNSVYNIPKKVLKGKDAGTLKAVRREDIKLYPISVLFPEEVLDLDIPFVENEAVKDDDGSVAEKDEIITGQEVESNGETSADDDQATLDTLFE